MAAPEILIDLDDGGPPTIVAKVEKPKSNGVNALKYRAPEVVEITVTPVALAVLFTRVKCLACGAIHRENRGLFLVSQLSNRVRQLRHITLREAAPFQMLPRILDEGPVEVVPFCEGCWHIDTAFFDAVAAAAAQPELFNGEGQSQPVDKLIAKLNQMDAEDAIQLSEGEL